MKIELSSQLGFCFGVKRAIEMVKNSRAKMPEPVYMLGPLVHNEVVVRKIKQLRIRQVQNLEPGWSKGTLIITAHGINPIILRQAAQQGLVIVDTTCPRVREIHSLAKKLSKEGRELIIYGDRDHIEIIGILGETINSGIVIGSQQEILSYSFSPAKKYALLSQTTKDLEEFTKIKEYLKEKIRDLQVYDTICGSTRLRQAEAKKLAANNDAMLIVGSKTSANTRRLFEVASRLNPATFWVQDKADLVGEQLAGAESVGIIGGASTPEELVLAIAKKIKKIA